MSTKPKPTREQVLAMTAGREPTEAPRSSIRRMVSWLQSKERHGMKKRIRDLKKENKRLSQANTWWRKRAIHAEGYIGQVSEKYRYGKEGFNDEYPN